MLNTDFPEITGVRSPDVIESNRICLVLEWEVIGSLGVKLA